jgi:hypothetical protein
MAMMTPRGQMFSAVSALKDREQRLHVYDLFDKTLTFNVVNERNLLGEGYSSAPWILPIGLDDKGHLIVKIFDSHLKTRGIRLIQRYESWHDTLVRCIYGRLTLFNAMP